MSAISGKPLLFFNVDDVQAQLDVKDALATDEAFKSESAARKNCPVGSSTYVMIQLPKKARRKT